MKFPLSPSAYTPTEILRVSDSLKMAGIDATASPTEVIPLQPFGRLAYQEVVGTDWLAMQIELAIPMGGRLPQPLETAISATGVYPKPEASHRCQAIDLLGRYISLNISREKPAVVVHTTPATFNSQSSTAKYSARQNGMSSSMDLHRVTSGVMGPDIHSVAASPIITEIR